MTFLLEVELNMDGLIKELCKENGWEKIIYHNEILSYKCPKCGNYQSYKTKACLLCRTKLGN